MHLRYLLAVRHDSGLATQACRFFLCLFSPPTGLHSYLLPAFCPSSQERFFGALQCVSDLVEYRIHDGRRDGRAALTAARNDVRRAAPDKEFLCLDHIDKADRRRD